MTEQSEQKFTPGPWDAENSYGDDPRWWIYPKGGATTICSTANSNDEANARLIAKAPELLEMLQEIAELDHDVLQYPNVTSSCLWCGRAQGLSEHKSYCIVSKILLHIDALT